jgi:mannosidase alpha-like ER degradation enhancer 2
MRPWGLVGAVPVILLLGFSAAPDAGSEELWIGQGIDRAERLQLREAVREMFYHGYNSYIENAFPMDELLPLSCQGVDKFGGWGLTAVDSMDALVIMGNCSEFERIARWAIDNIDFDRNKTVSLFETNIRILGGLLSSHMMAMDPDLPCFKARPYNNGLLHLAHDLGLRMLPAFDTPTGIPYGSVNLRYGVDAGESNVTATAAAGTLAMEFWTLSQLTSDDRFSDAAKNAVRGLWKYRSALNLVGAHINIQTGEWTQKESGIGGLVDSFYEYLLKAAILTEDMEYLHMFNQAYAAAMSNLKLGPWYLDVNMDTGGIVWPSFSSLQCFWPGLQALIGDVEAAAETAEAFHRMWLVHGATPETFNLHKKGVPEGQAGYPLRPELAESAMYLHEATDDPAYLELGKQIVTSLQSLTRVPCGFASMKNVVSKELDDIMDSFFLSETCK